jgi:exosortase
MSVPAKSLWRALAICAALSFAYASVLTKLANDWWTDDNYSHGLLVPFVIVYILWVQRHSLARDADEPKMFWGLVVVVFALIILWAGIAGAELYMQRMSLVAMVVGISIYFYGFRLLRLILVPLGLLILAIPIPAIIFNKIAFPLQLFASRCAVWSMSIFDIPVLRQGNVIELIPLNSMETKKLEVVEACSGIRSLMTLVTLAFVFAYFTHSPSRSEGPSNGPLSWLRSYNFWRSPIIVLSAIPIAIITNAFRVSGTGILAHYFGTHVADGFFHTFSGWVIYVVAFLILFAVGWIVERFKPAQTDKGIAELVTVAKSASEPTSAVIKSPGAVAQAEGAD